MSAVKSLKILCRLDFPSATVRLWSGSGPYLDREGNIWRCCVVSDDALDSIEAGINGEAVTLPLTLSGIDKQIADVAWQETDADDVIGSVMQILIQDCDEYDQPIGNPDVAFTGTMDNVVFDDAVSGDHVLSTITAEITNRFTLRTLTNGAVLSDVDQRARSAILNPNAPADLFCERVPGLNDKTIRWPSWN
ncbi:hypothetical protein [Mesorhizobium sp. RMAD-H1]|uniref:hypothetical protein n=1 Tax=Mesorhizobium sp. RMAD-H1 TaxID=2587065 RepID=UPI00160F915A|nr:hypothetical protein [Mesorhizobium sp. RMAD-H1]MBB2973942.1 hypothetical protein [Mesorhizobium sp. RMAD-H1]